MSEEELLTVSEAAARAKCSPETVRQWIKDGKLPNRKTPGGHFRVRVSELDAAIPENGVEPAGIAPVAEGSDGA